MINHKSLFYGGGYEIVQSDISKIKDRTIQEEHNLIISKYLFEGDLPNSGLEGLLNSIRKDMGSNSWSSHPSYSLILYHISLYHFRVCNYNACKEILSELWQNIESIDNCVKLCIIILSLEYSICTSESFYVEKSMEIIDHDYNSPEKINDITKHYGIDGISSKSIEQCISAARIRLEVSKYTNGDGDQTKQELDSIIAKAEISPDSKSRQIIPVGVAIPLACAALYVGDFMRFQSALESSDDPFNFAILNNRGIHELNQKRYSSAILHFSRAMNTRTNSELIYPFHQIVYNFALSLHMKRKFYKAFQYFYMIIPFMSKNPFFWFRLAECIVHYYKYRVAKLRLRKQYSPIIAQRLVTTSCTIYVLPMSDRKLFESNKKNVKDLDLVFGEKCARNCISLVGENPNLMQLKRSAELICSFLYLEMNNGKRAVEMAKSIITDNTVDRTTQLLSKVYSAQGFLLSGEREEASKMSSRLLVERDLKREKEQQLLMTLTFILCLIENGENPRVEEKLSKAKNEDGKRTEVILIQIAHELKRKHYKQVLSIIHSNLPNTQE